MDLSSDGDDDNIYVRLCDFETLVGKVALRNRVKNNVLKLFGVDFTVVLVRLAKYGKGSLCLMYSDVIMLLEKKISITNQNSEHS